MFYLIRYIIAILIFGIVFLLVGRNAQQDKKIVFGLAMTVAFYILVLSNNVKVENILFSFETPNAAYEYGLEKKNGGEVEHTLYGEHSALVICEEDVMLIPKSDDGWKLGHQNDLNAIAKQLTLDYIAIVYQYRNTNDYFVCVEKFFDNEIKVSDSVGSDFVYYEELNEYWTYLPKKSS